MPEKSYIGKYLQETLETYRLGLQSRKVKKGKNARAKIMEIISSEYGADIAGGIIPSGSIAKATAINLNYDFDLVVPFKHGVFSSPREMYHDLFDYLLSERRRNPDEFTYFRKQRVSVGIKYWGGKRFGEIHLDVVPAIEKHNNKYSEDGYLLLWDDRKRNSYQTNIKRQNEAINACHNSARKIIQLLKIWKSNQCSVRFKSFVMETAVIEAMNSHIPPRGLWEQLRMAMKYIADNFCRRDYKLYDPGYSENDLMISHKDNQVQIAGTFRNILKRIDRSPHLIKTYFPKK